MKFGAIVSARMGSTRLPGKAMLPLMGQPVIALLLRRIRTSKLLSSLIVATTAQPEDDVLARAASATGTDIYRGPIDDVLNRYVLAGKRLEADYIVRITGNCPFVDGPTLDLVLRQVISKAPFDLLTTKPAYPPGIDFEIYAKQRLETINSLTLPPTQRENIFSYIMEHESEHTVVRVAPPDNLRCTEPIFLLDTPEDYERMQRMTAGISNIHISPAELIKRQCPGVPTP
jgi:spore coat polysaccharide biosynthesis protein SpsF (cytidylyltransferase family)